MMSSGPATQSRLKRACLAAHERRRCGEGSVVKEWMRRRRRPLLEAHGPADCRVGVVSRAGAAAWPKQEAAVGRGSRGQPELWQSAERAPEGGVKNKVLASAARGTQATKGTAPGCVVLRLASARLAVSGVA
jgi:hypothetical protein